MWFVCSFFHIARHNMAINPRILSCVENGWNMMLVMTMIYCTRYNSNSKPWRHRYVIMKIHFQVVFFNKRLIIRILLNFAEKICIRGLMQYNILFRRTWAKFSSNNILLQFSKEIIELYSANTGGYLLNHWLSSGFNFFFAAHYNYVYC